MGRALLVALSLSTAALGQGKPLSLAEAVITAREKNSDYQLSRLQTLSAQQDLVIARSAILPRVDFNASLGETLLLARAPPGNVSAGYLLGLGVRQLVFDGGKWWNNLAVASLGLASVKANEDEEALQITFLVEQRFYELVRGQRQLGVLLDAAGRSREQADNVQHLHEGGRATQADVYAALANRDNDEIQRIFQASHVELARTDLALALGTDPREPVALVEPPRMMDDPEPPPEEGEAIRRALANRPALKAFEALLESQRKQVSVARGDYWPSVSVGAGVSRSTQEFTALTSASQKGNALSAAVNLSWNLFNGLATRAGVRKSELQVLVSEAELANGRRSVAADVEKAISQLAAARAVAVLAAQAEQRAGEGLRLARKRQQVAVGTQLEVRDAELKLTQAQLAHVGALVDGRVAEAALRRAQGG